MQDEITLKDLLRSIAKSFSIVRKKWLIILIISVITGVAGFFYSWFKPITYEANASFGVEGKSGGGSSVLALASQLGFPLGGSGIFPDNKMLVGIAASRKVIKSSLLYRDTSKHGSLCNASRCMRLFNMIPKEAPDYHFKTFDINHLEYQEDSLLDIIYEKSMENMVSLSIDEEVGLVRMKVKSTDPDFAVQLSKNIIYYTNLYFIVNSKQEAQYNFAMAQQKADSILKVISNKEVELALMDDSRTGIIKAQGKIAQTRLIRDLAILNKMYAEVVANVEIQKYSLDNEQTILIIVDEPNFSLKTNERHKTRFAIVLFFLAFVFASITFISIDYFSSVLKRKDNENL